MVVADYERTSEVVPEHMRFLNVVCLGLVASVAAYSFVAWFLSSTGALAGPGLPNGFAIAGAVVAFALLAAAPIVRRKMLEKAAQSALSGDGGTAAAEGYRMATLLAFILREGAAIVGLMLTILTNEPVWCYALGAITVVAMFTSWPRREELEAVLAGRPATT